MSLTDLELDHLPLQNQLVQSACTALSSEDNVVAAVLLGSLAAGKGDRVSDADIIAFTQNDFHQSASSCIARFEKGKEIFYCLDGYHSEKTFFRKYIFNDLTSAEIHFVDSSEPFTISKPYKVLFDRGDIVANRLNDEPAPKHEDSPVYKNGDDGLIWELFNCIKWLSRDDKELAKSYLKRLSAKL